MSETTKTPLFYSQNGEDILLSKAFAEQDSGYYVELGSHDGIHLSNTMHFEQIGWTGLLVEAHTVLAEDLKQNRKASACLNVAVSEDDGEIDFYQTSHGSLSTFDVSQRDYFIKNRSDVTADSYQKVKVRTTGTTTLLVEAQAPATIDFMSIDIEGAELAALRTLDFDKYDVRVFIVEFDRKQKQAAQEVETLLTSHGYRIVRTIGANAFWVKEEALGHRIQNLAFAGTLNYIKKTNGTITHNTVEVSYAAGEQRKRRTFVQRMRQSLKKRIDKYSQKAA